MEEKREDSDIMNTKGVYIHIPFCRSICSYCDFCKVLYKQEWVIPYLKKLNREIKDLYMDDKIDTIYIGGGTPSSLSLEELEILFKIVTIFNTELKEFTFECNLNDINENLLKVLKENNVTRLSIGIETFNEDLQILIKREHTFEEAKEKIDLCRKYGFNNINLDLMYAYKDETLDVLKEDLEFITSFNPEHISCYSLILEEHTKLYIDKIKPIDEELDNKMYYFICKYLKEMGYNHIEVSNFAKDGFNPLHNLVYWDNKEYYGFGCGASGYINNKRYSNSRSITKYLDGIIDREYEDIDINKNMEYEMILGLRKIKGVSISEFYNKFNKDIKEVFDVDNLIKEGLLNIDEDYIYIPEDKIYISNSILVNFIGGVSD